MSKLDSAATGTLIFAAAALAVSVLWKTFRPPVIAGAAPTMKERSKDWKQFSEFGYTIAGSTKSPVQVAIFGDLQCPSCKAFHRSALPALARTFGDSVQVVFLSLPLDYHEAAMPAARILDCAERAGISAKWLDVAYEHQTRLGKAPWDSLVALASTERAKDISACATDTVSVAKVARAKEFGSAINIRGTPTVLINDRVIQHTPGSAELDSLIRRAMMQSR